MKWPRELVFIRHGESGYNILRKQKESDPRYRRFRASFEQNPGSLSTRIQAWYLWRKYQLGCGDSDTPLTEAGLAQPVIVGRKLRETTSLPETIFVSPHDRAHMTLNGLIAGWPELGSVRVVEEPRIREQEHGLALIYNDRRIFHALHPLQRRLYELEGSYWYRYPQGENVPDGIERARSFIGTLVRDYSETNVMIVSHHLWILFFLAAIFRWDAKEFLEWDKNKPPINCGVTTFRGNPAEGKDGKLELVEYNQKLY